MRTQIFLTASLLLASCTTATVTEGPDSTPDGPRYLVGEDLDVSSIGVISDIVVTDDAVSLIGTAGQRVLGSESAVTPWPTPSPSSVVVLRRSGTTPVMALAAQNSVRFVVSGGGLAGEYVAGEHAIKRLFAIDVDGDGNDEAIATLDGSDEVHCISRTGERLWALRWGGDVNHIIQLPTSSPTMAYSDGIGLVVRAGDGTVVSRNRPPSAGNIRSVELFHDIASFAGASIGITHQRPGQAAKVDLYTLDGGGARGTLTVEDVAPFRTNVALTQADVTWYVSGDVAADGTLTVRAFDADHAPMWTQAVPGDLDPIHLTAHNGAVIVATGHTARRYTFATP